MLALILLPNQCAKPSNLRGFGRINEYELRSSSWSLARRVWLLMTTRGSRVVPLLSHYSQVVTTRLWHKSNNSLVQVFLDTRQTSQFDGLRDKDHPCGVNFDVRRLSRVPDVRSLQHVPNPHLYSHSRHLHNVSRSLLDAILTLSCLCRRKRTPWGMLFHFGKERNTLKTLILFFLFFLITQSSALEKLPPAEFHYHGNPGG